ncbi:MAG: CoA pyrophosphatase [Haloarculaceae archaeon]
MNLDGVAANEPTRIEGVDRQAAVLVPVIERQTDREPHLLFIKRSDYGDHAGQMAFPGGGREPEDEDLFATALRESDEEVDLDPSTVTYVGQLDDIETVTGYSVSPFVARVPDAVFTPDEREVAEIAVLPVADLTDLANYECERRHHPTYGDIKVHYFHVGGYTVWGATGRILVQFLELTTDWRVPEGEEYVADSDADLGT